MLPTVLEAGIALSRRRVPGALRRVSTTTCVRDSGSEPGPSAPSSSSSASSSSSPSDPAPTPSTSAPPSPLGADPAHADTLRAQRIDQLWDRVVRTPAAVAGGGGPTRSILEQPTRATYPRKLRGTTMRAHRAAGQTPHEAQRFNAILSGILDKLGAGEGGEWRANRPQKGLPFEPPQFRRKEDDASPELRAAVDAAVEQLSVLGSAAEVVAWAEANLFCPGDAGAYPAIYGRMFPRVLGALRRLNAPHVALALFEHARALGLESYLAACNTAAYNELLAIRWGHFRDLHGVYAGVREMEVNAVFWDKKTAEVVGGVVDEVGREILGRTGSSHRWGSDAYVALAQLEQRIADDTARQERIFDVKAQVRRRGNERGGEWGRGAAAAGGEWRGRAGGSGDGHGRGDGHRRAPRPARDEADDWA